MTFGNLFDKFKTQTKHAAGQMKLAGRIAGLKVERSTQKAERERLLKEIGSKTFSIYSKTKALDSATLEEEIINELHHIERIDKRMTEIEDEINELQSEIMNSEGKDVVDADEVQEAEDSDDDEEDDDGNKNNKGKSKEKK